MPTPTLPESYQFFREQVYRHSGIVLHEKEYLVEARLMPIAHEHGLPDLNSLCERLKRDPKSPLHQRVAEAMTTNETYFFREPPHYEALRQIIIPRWMAERQASRTLRFWSAASSTGQEAYSLAILLAEMGLCLCGWRFEILATDISSRALERARAGRYFANEISRGLSPTLLLKYFDAAGSDWQVKTEIRRMVRFQQFDLRSPTGSLGPFEVVLCRNVLIYFDTATRQAVLEGIHATLHPGGHLLLATTEPLLQPGELYERDQTGFGAVYIARTRNCGPRKL